MFQQIYKVQTTKSSHCLPGDLFTCFRKRKGIHSLLQGRHVLWLYSRQSPQRVSGGGTPPPPLCGHK